jgi:predicted PurR-regulated permease PerM
MAAEQSGEPHRSAESKENAPGHSSRGIISEHVFIRRMVIATSIVALFIILFLLLAYAPDALILTFGAVWFGCLLHFAALTTTRWTGLSQRWSLTVVVALLVLLMLGFFLLLGWQLAGRIDELASNLSEAADAALEQLEAAFPQVQTLLKRTSPAKAAQVVFGGKSTSAVTGLLATPFGFVIDVLYIFFTGLYLAASPQMYRDGFVALVPVQHRKKFRHVCNEAGEALWKWTLARVASMAIIGCLAWIGLALLGIPMSATLAVLTALFEFIPNIGPILSLIPPMLLSMSKGPYLPLYVILLYTGIQFVESYLVTPIIHQREDNLPAALVIAVQLLFGILFGLLGVAFAMPITLVAMLFIQRFYIERGLEDTDEEREIGTHS